MKVAEFMGMRAEYTMPCGYRRKVENLNRRELEQALIEEAELRGAYHALVEQLWRAQHASGWDEVLGLAKELQADRERRELQDRIREMREERMDMATISGECGVGSLPKTMHPSMEKEQTEEEAMRGQLMQRGRSAEERIARLRDELAQAESVANGCRAALRAMRESRMREPDAMPEQYDSPESEW